MTTYAEFLDSKAAIARESGFPDADPADVNPVLKPHQRDAVLWAVRGGRRAIFASFGLGKSVMQLEAVRLTMAHVGRGARGLIVCPLGVRQEFVRDARDLLGWDEDQLPRFVRSHADASEPGIYLTNYESIRDGKLDPTGFDVITLDEAAILRGFGGTKTFRELMRLYEGSSAYRFVATATPSPNDYIELLAYAAFLDVLDVGQAKTRFFKRDSEHADNLTLLPHMESEFWHWVASWALFISKPSDLGYSDEDYDLPDLEVVWHEIPAAAVDEPLYDRHGRGELFRDTSLGVQAAAAEKRASIGARVAKMTEIIASTDPDEHFLIWHDQEAERHAIAEVLPVATWGRWHEYRDGHPRALELYERHYSAYHYADGRERKLFMGPGEKTVLLTADGKALFGWRKFKDDSGQTGVCCAVFRNEGPHLSSDLIREAMAIAWKRWPGERLYTYVNSEKVRSENPGYCFKQAGWTHRCNTTGGLAVLDAIPPEFPHKMLHYPASHATAPLRPWAEGIGYFDPIDMTGVPDVTRGPGLKSVWGSQDLDEREDRILGFSEGEFPYLSTKPVIAGSGCNFQRHCHRAVFVGIGFRFADFIQSIHRIHRFGQTQPVRIDLIYTEAERTVREKLERKWRNHERLVSRMTEIVRELGITREAIENGVRRSRGVERVEVFGDNYRCILNDTVEECGRFDTDSVGLIVTSIPFSTQYEYSPTTEDFGHNADNDAFWAQMDYLTPNLLRVLKPGRVAAIHVKDRIVPGGVNGLGFRTLQPFHAEAIAHYMRHGFAFLGMVTVVTDVVRENNQTYRLSYTAMTQDGSSVGVGVPEYVLLFRKPQTDRSKGFADEPVTKTKGFVCSEHADIYAKAEKYDDTYDFDPADCDDAHPCIPGYTLARWQTDAHGFWRTGGNRHLMPQEFAGLSAAERFRLFRDHYLNNVYDYADHLVIGDSLAAIKELPVDFMLLQPPSWHPDVWTDVARMRTLNMVQTVKGWENHLCPLQFDIVDRIIERWSNEGDVVLDPFAGIMTVPYRAIGLGREGWGVELSSVYFRDGVAHVKAVADEVATPTLFDLLDGGQDDAEAAS